MQHRVHKCHTLSVRRCEKCGRSLHKECISLAAKCDSGRHGHGQHGQQGQQGGGPPRLPPRPPSMQLPTPNGANIHNRFSSVSIDETEKQPSSLLLRLIDSHTV